MRKKSSPDGRRRGGSVPVARLGEGNGASAHGGRKVGQLVWNNTAEGILTSAGSDHTVSLLILHLDMSSL
jgi:hypothetical protein